MTKQELGEFVRDQRKARGLTQKELADKLSIRRQAILEIENAQWNYGIDILLQILDSFGYQLFPKSLATKKFKFTETKSLTK